MRPGEPHWLAPLERPTLLLWESRARQNIRRMSQRMAAADVALRPHFKTHQCVGIGEWFRDEGTTGICVSSLPMAAHFADAGWKDITVAVPFNPLAAATAVELSRRIRLNLLCDCRSAVEPLAGSGAADPIRIWIKTDTGYGRAGIRWDDPGRIVDLALWLRDSAGVEFAGLLTHAGHSYHQSGPREVRRVWTESILRLREAGAAVAQAMGAVCPLSAGDTPGCSLAADLSGPDELRPGNFVLYDLMQMQIGACSGDDIAAAVACPVIGLDESRREVLLHGGAVHLSREYLGGAGSGPCFGMPAHWRGSGWEGPVTGARLTGLSQEHGVLKVDNDDFWSRLEVGRAIPVLPVHSCLAADLFPEFITTDGRRLPRRRSNDPAAGRA